tara:strand:+ start:231 stop:479 length:249 start_codon:yes stop_codon:yes gene_type:complete
MKFWRSGSPKMVTARTIKEKDIPKLLQAMSEDGLYARIDDSGITFELMEYELTHAAVMKAWGITISQWKRLMNYIYVNGWVE